MKLRNKKTGEIRCAKTSPYDNGIRLFVTDTEASTTGKTYYYHSLAELNEEWEDYEEPKEHWYITADGAVWTNPESLYKDSGFMKEIGNYFETKEEAEKAVEKLKAWERLKDEGFKFCGYEMTDGTIRFSLSPTGNGDEEYSDLRLLFGGEDD